MRALMVLVRIYLICFVLMLLYLLFIEDVPFESALKPSVIWPKTLIDMIKAA